jgi:hypothetical protein
MLSSGWLLIGDLLPPGLILSRKVLSQSAKAALPHGAALGEPIFRTAKRAHFEPAGSYPPDLDRLNQPSLAQDLKMLEDGGKRHIERRGQFRNRCRTIGQLFDYCSSGRVA